MLLLVTFFWVTMCPRLTWNLLCTLGWSWTQRDSLSASWSAKLIVLFTFLFFICLSLYVCVCAVVEQFQLYILEFASNASLSLFFFHYGIVLNSWFSNLRFVCAGIAGVHHHTMLYFDDISSFFSLVICFYYHHILILTELIFSEFSSKSPVCLPGLFKKAWRHF